MRKMWKEIACYFITDGRGVLSVEVIYDIKENLSSNHSPKTSTEPIPTPTDFFHTSIVPMRRHKLTYCYRDGRLVKVVLLQS